MILFSSNRVITVAELRHQRLTANQPRCPSGRWWPCPKSPGKEPRPTRPRLPGDSSGGRRASSGWVTTRAPAVKTSPVNLCPAVPSNLRWWRVTNHPQMECGDINLSQAGDARRSQKQNCSEYFFKSDLFICGFFIYQTKNKINRMETRALLFRRTIHLRINYILVLEFCPNFQILKVRAQTKFQSIQNLSYETMQIGK